MSTHEPPYTPHDDEDTTTIDIESSIGWEPPETKKYKRALDEYARRDKTIWAWNSMVEARSANEWMRPAAGEQRTKREAGDLFGTLWREGELAVLAAETGVGKSVLAVQIADAIARGGRIEPFRFTGSPPYEGGVDAALRGRRGGSLRGRPVLYIDLERTGEQFRQRYSVAAGRRRAKHKFPAIMDRVGIRDIFDPPEGFRGDLNEYLFHSIESEIRRSGTRVVIIDSLAHFAASPARFAGVMRTLRLWCAQANLSILAIAHIKSRHLSSPVSRLLSLRDLAPQLAQFADSVFCLSRSTMREDIRYLKHLKSTSTPITLDDRSVATFTLGRTAPAGPQAASLPSTSATEPTEMIESTLATTTPHSALRIPQSDDLSLVTCHGSPFLGLSFLGFTAEELHLKDYAAEAQKVETAEATRLKRLRTGSVVDMVLSPEYQRYLKGE